MPVSSYRKYTIIFDIIGLLLFLGIMSFGISMFYFDLPSDHHTREGLYFAMTSCGICIYIISLIYQIRKCRVERNQYLPLQ